MARKLLPLAVLLLVPAPATAESPPRILATGDSMIQIVDVKLKARLKRIEPVSFRSEARVGEGITKQDWVRIARKQVARHRPRATVVYLGANDGFPIRGARCCGEKWLDYYRARVAKMMQVYARGGNADVYWLTLPAPRPRVWRKVYPTVNRAIRRAAKAGGPHVHLIDTYELFSPHDRFQQTIVYHGKRVSVRQSDGVHLNWTGASIAAGLVRQAMVRDKVVG